jgi:hypothetical protein
MAQLDRYDARAILTRIGVSAASPPDFHTLSSATVERVLSEADARRYRKAAGAPGSRGRMFYQYVTRAAARPEA